MEDRCVCCGAIIPEWMQVCPKCKEKVESEQKQDDGKSSPRDITLK